MGILRRAVDLADRVYNASDLSGLSARFNRRRGAPVQELLDTGDATEAVVTGFRRWAQADGDHATDAVTLRLEWTTPSGERTGAAVITGQGERSPALRLGVRIPVRYDELHVVPAHTMPAGSSVGWAEQIPDRGIENARGRRPKRRPSGTIERAEVQNLARRSVPLLGVPADRWDITLQLADGATAVAADGAAPSYVHHLLAPGAEVPIRVDPGGRTRVWIDWIGLADEHAATAGHVEDPPPPDSIAAEFAGSESAPTASGGGAAGSGDPIDTGVVGDAIEGVTLELYACIQAARQTARIPPEEYDDFAAREHGVPPGRWHAVDRAWQQRMMADWRVGAAYAEAIEAARRR